MTTIAKLEGFLAHLNQPFPVELLYCKTKTFDYRRKRTTVDVRPLYTISQEQKVIIGRGLLVRILREYPSLQCQIESENSPVLPNFLAYDSEKFNLRDYQKSAIESILFSKSGIVRLPTGTGKNEIQIATAHTFLPYTNVMIFSPTEVGVETIKERARKYGVPCVSYQESRSIPGLQNTIIATIPLSLVNDIRNKKNTKTIESCRALLVDECHHLEASTWGESFQGLKNLERCYGFSATVLDFDQPVSVLWESEAVMLAYCGEVIYSRSAKDPEISKYIDTPDLYCFPYTWQAPYSITKWEVLARMLEGNYERHELIAQIVDLFVSHGFTCLSIVARKKSARTQFLKVHHPSIQWFGGKDVRTNDARKGLSGEDIIRNFGTHYKSIFATSHLNEIVNIPALDVIILSENTSKRITVQRSGRTVRLGGKKSVIVNIEDKGVKMLESHSRKRKSTVEDEFGVQGVQVGSLEALKEIIIEKYEGN